MNHKQYSKRFNLHSQMLGYPMDGKSVYSAIVNNGSLSIIVHRLDNSETGAHSQSQSTMNHQVAELSSIKKD